MKKLLILLPFLSVILATSLYARTLHLVALGDTNEKKIGVAVQNNLQEMSNIFSHVAAACEISFNQKLVIAESLTHARAVAELTNLPVKKDDILIVYYAGHGARKKRTPTIWPIGFANKNPDFNHLFFSEIIDHAVSKNAALSIILLDCCNKYTSEPITNLMTQAIPQSMEEDTLKVLQELFFNRYGVIVASAAAPWNATYCGMRGNSGPISFFTSSFLTNFSHAMLVPNYSWRSILEATKLECQRMNTLLPQLPQYKIFLYTKRKSPELYKKSLDQRCRYKSRTRANRLAKMQ